IVGGAIWSRMARTVVASSIAPAAEIVWPIIDLVELMRSRAACGPKTALSAAVSTRSFIGVEVPWAFTYTMHSAPPASAMSTVPRRIARYASPIAWADEVHAVWIVAVGPSMPKTPASLDARYWGHVRYDRSRATRRANSPTNPDGVTRPSAVRLA